MFKKKAGMSVGRGAGGKKKAAQLCCTARKVRHRPTLPRVTAVPSALAGLTALFGMGRGGHRRYRHLNILVISPKPKGIKLKATFPP